jgi:hypothetical protein
MAYIDDAVHSGRPLYASRSNHVPRQILTLAALATSVSLWAIMVLVVARLY